MAKKQTRRGVSLPDAIYKAATELARERGITLAHLTCEGLRAVGVNVDTPHRPLEHADKAVAEKANAAATRTLEDVARERTTPPPDVEAPWCAYCTKVRPPYTLEDGKAMCGVCSGEHPRSGRYSFSGGRPDPRSGGSEARVIGQGNRTSHGKGHS